MGSAERGTLPSASVLIKNGMVLTVDPANTVIRDGAVVIQADRIRDVGPSADLAARYDAEVTIDAAGNLVLPGLINAHTHGLNYLTRGLGMDGSLLRWLNECIVPFSLEMSEEDAYYGALLSFLENLRLGNTLVVDNFYAPGDRRRNADQVARAAEEVGIRAVLARLYVDRPGRARPEFVEKVPDVLREYERLIRTWHGKDNGRIQIWVAPVTLPSCSSDSIISTHELAQHYGVGMHTHCGETQESVQMVLEQHGKPFVQVFHELGVLGPRFHSVHSVWLQEAELGILRDADAKVIHNPVANMLLAEGAAPVPAMRAMGITVALGTDSPNNRQDMIESMKAAVLLHRVTTLDTGALCAQDALRMATIGGARSLGCEDELGSLEVGKKADVVVVDVHRFHTVPMHDPIGTLVYSCTGRDVDTVLVDGQVLVREGRVLGWDEQQVVGTVQSAAEHLRDRATVGIS